MRTALKDRELERLVSALCADYERREQALSLGTVSRRTALEYKYLNYKIRAAVESAVGERDAERFIRDIGNNTGYAKTELDYYSESVYKRRKAEAKYGIAKCLHLVD